MKNRQITEELQFYLDLQNPDTGAFMDEAYPLCTYTGPTGNVLLHLESLAENTGQLLQLKYPLKYLDEINTPEKMKAYLDDVSTVGWIKYLRPFHIVGKPLQYQPTLDLVSNQICGFEALARLNSDKFGFISPVEFIPDAEAEIELLKRKESIE